MNDDLKTSQEGISLIKSFEGCELSAYRCSANVPTIGYGHTAGVSDGDTCTLEEAEEMLDVTFEGDAIEIGFNVSYVLDVLNTLRCDNVRVSMSDANASALIENADDDSAMYVVMPIRL